MSNLKSLPKMPSLPKMKSVNRCECGCKGLTGNRFVPGHDSKLAARVKRVQANVFNPSKPGDVMAQLDAALDYLTISEVEALGNAVGVTWDEDEAMKRLDSETYGEPATGTGN